MPSDYPTGLASGEATSLILDGRIAI